MIVLESISARGVAERGRPRPVLNRISLEHRTGVLAILGAPKDGTSLLLDVIDGSARPSAGRVRVLDTTPEGARARLARVTLDAPLPEELTVEEVANVAGVLRGEPGLSAAERLGALGLGTLARRRVRSLTTEERRAVALALALTGTKTEVILVEEPLASLDPTAPRLVVDLLRRRSMTASVVVTTGSARDAARLADRIGVLTGGVLLPLAPVDLQQAAFAPQGMASMRVVVSPASGKAGAAALAGILGADASVMRVETTAYAAGAAVALTVTGDDAGRLARALTHAIAAAGVDVELIEPSALSVDALRAALAAREVSPPPGSLPPRAGA